MSCPIYIGGERSGALTETREGLYRVLRADCAMREGLHRLWLHGGGRSVYFGLLAPEGGRLRLEKRFSRASGLPEAIDCASDRPAAPKPESAASAPTLRRQSRYGGALLFDDGRFRYLALPARLSPASPAAGRLRRIDGKDYLVFRCPERYNKST